MKIVVTGGAGYIGSVLCEELILKLNAEVVCIDNLYFQQVPNPSLFHHQKFKFVNLDVRNTEALFDHCREADVIIPLAALVGAPLCKSEPILSRDTNLNSIITLVEKLSPNQKILLPITNSGYGIGEAGKECDETSPLNPISQYGIDKVTLESHLLKNHENFVSFRLATVFGCSPRMRTDLLVNDFVYRATRDGFLVLFEQHFVRNYIHVRDVTGAFIFALKNWDKFRNNVFNLGLTSANLSKLELAEKIKKEVKDLTIVTDEFKKDPDQRDYIVSNKKIESRGFFPSHSIEDGIRELSEFYRSLPRGNFSNV